MSIILNIDTAITTSSICLAENDKPLAIKINPLQKDSAAWLHIAVKQLLHELNFTLAQVDAIAVIEGPGSYTGLRIGMATAKGLCYASKKRLIVINSLRQMAFVARKEYDGLLCPMIDARRMEVFTAIFSQQLNFILPPSNLVLNETTFTDLLQENSILFFGDGSTKFQPLIKHPNALFANIETDATAMVGLSFQKFLKKEFADLAYSQPFYGKDFHSIIIQSL